jgi:ribosomal protein S27E
MNFNCPGCGADLVFAPGTEKLNCPYCGREVNIAAQSTAVEERDYREFLQKAAQEHELQEVVNVKCTGCGAETTLPPNVTTDACPFCGTNLIASKSQSKKLIKPEAILPFAINHDQAKDNLTRWINSLWFAPNKLKTDAEKDRLLKGLYLPYWTYDCNTFSRYSGERGEHYYETQHYTVMENGRSVRRSRQVQRTRWYPASGSVTVDFDDVLIPATSSLPRNYLDELMPWDLPSLVAYKNDYLAGFRTESYQVPLENGFEQAKQIMDGEIRSAICRDIGGDVQRIHSASTEHSDITFKHILLPVWVGAYRYQGKVYQFQVNARTGEVQGPRPWSWVKIAFALFVALIVILVILYLSSSS